MFRRLRWPILAALLGACGGPSGAPVRAQSATTSPATTEPDPAPPPRDDGRLPGGVSPTEYRIELTVDPRKPTFLGKTSIAVRVEKPSRALVLHGRSLTVQTAALTAGDGKKHWARARLRKGARTKGDPEELVLVFEEEVDAGPATLDIEYEAPFARGLRGLYRVDEGGAHYAYTQLEPNDARRMFPCFDEPEAKVPFQLSVTVPEGQLAISNTPEVGRREDGAAELVTFEFAKSPPMPTYLVALGVGPFDVIEGQKSPVPIRLVSVRGKSGLGQLALDAAKEQLPLLREYFGKPYPYKKLDLVAVPDFAAGAMENAGFVTFREELLLLDPARASTNARRRLGGVMAHELAHMWFGNLVTMRWWDDLWLNEGFATWMATKIVDRWKPSLGSGKAAVGRKSMVMRGDTMESARKIRQPVRSTSEALEAFDGITYVKGQAVISMIEQWTGEEAFRNGVRDYLGKHEWRNATAADLFAALGAASGKDVASVMDTFTDQTGVPRVDAKLVCKPKPVVELSQTEHRPLGPGGKAAESPKAWRLPVCVRYEAGKKSNEPKRACALLAEKTATIELEGEHCPRWVHPNANEAGYYRYRLDPASSKRLVEAAPKALSAEERIGLVANAWALVHSGDLRADEFLAMLPAFSGDRERVVWETIVEALGDVGRNLVDDAQRGKFRALVAEVLGPRARAVGWKPRPKETEDQRLERRVVLTALGQLGRDGATLARASKLAAKWMADPAAVDSDVAAVAVPLAAGGGDAAMLAGLVERLKGARTPEERVLALSGLSNLQGPELVKKVLALTLDGTIRVQDLRYVFGPIFLRKESREVAYPWVKANFDALVERLPSFIVGRFVWVAASLCEREHIDAARSFFEPKLATIEGADKHLRQAVEAGRLCASRRSFHREKVNAWLASR